MCSPWAGGTSTGALPPLLLPVTSPTHQSTLTPVQVKAMPADVVPLGSPRGQCEERMSWALLFGLSEEGAVWVHFRVAIRDMQGMGEVLPGSSPPESGMWGPVGFCCLLSIKDITDCPPQALILLGLRPTTVQSASSASSGVWAFKNSCRPFQVDPHTPGLSQEHLASAPWLTVSWCRGASHSMPCRHMNHTWLLSREGGWVEASLSPFFHGTDTTPLWWGGDILRDAQLCGTGTVLGRQYKLHIIAHPGVLGCGSAGVLPHWASWEPGVGRCV